MRKFEGNDIERDPNKRYSSRFRLLYKIFSSSSISSPYLNFFNYGRYYLYF